MLLTRRYPELFPVGEDGKPTADHVAKLLDVKFDPSLLPQKLHAARPRPKQTAEGQSKYMLNLYLRERGDANIKSNADLIAKANYYDEPKFRTPAARPREHRGGHAVRHVEAHAAAVLGAADDPAVHGRAGARRARVSDRQPAADQARRARRSASERPQRRLELLGAQGFPVITVPAGFTTEVYDWIRDPNAEEIPESAFVNPTGGGGGGGNQRTEADRRIRLAGPTPAVLPVGVDFVGRPFDEPLILRIAAAYEAATRHRKPPPEFGPLPGKP